MADDYAAGALSQRAALEATHPEVVAAARQLADEPVLRVADLGAADGVNSHGLIRALVAERGGRALVYALVDLPTNPWAVAADHLRGATTGLPEATSVAVLPAPGDAGPGVADVGTGAHFSSADAHARACERALGQEPAPLVLLSMAGIPLHEAPCLPAGSVHIGVSGTAMHWVADTGGFPSTGSVFPGHRDHADASERGAWAAAAARDWERLLELRATELAAGGRLIVALPASSRPWPEADSVYREVVADMNRLLAEWRRAGRIGREAAAAVCVPVWMRTLDEIRAPFAAGGGRFAGLELERAEIFHLDNPYRRPDPASFARAYVQSLTAWGGPLFLRAFSLEGGDGAPALVDEFLLALEERVASDPERYRWDYTEALIVCRRVPAP